jgi:hypothetical protein
VFVICLAELKAKPDASHANTHPINDWSCHICNQHRAPSPPLADLVLNPTPPGQISRDRALLVDDQLDREIGWQSFEATWFNF